MSPQDLAPVDILRVGNILGECILWDWRRDALWWTDIQAKKLHRYDWAHRSLRVMDTPERVASFGFVLGSTQLIAAFESGVALYGADDQSVSWLARPEARAPGERFNDGRVDRHGRFWTGTMLEGGHRAAHGRLYSVGIGGELRCHVSGIRISNGLCQSPDGRRLYFADSPLRRISVYELNALDGTLGPPRLFAETPEGAYPDGAAVDADGCVWSAHWGGGCIVRYTPDGKIDRRLRVPTRQPSCVCFGGPDLELLCVTSAREGLEDSVLSAEPHAGDVFLYRTGIKGLPESEYRS